VAAAIYHVFTEGAVPLVDLLGHVHRWEVSIGAGHTVVTMRYSGEVFICIGISPVPKHSSIVRADAPLRKEIRAFLAKPVGRREDLQGPRDDLSDLDMSEKFARTFRRYPMLGLERTCNRVTYGRLLGVVNQHLQDERVFFKMCEEDGRIQKAEVEFLGADPADLADRTDKDVIVSKNFNAFVQALTLLASDKPLPRSEYLKAIRIAKHGEPILANAKRYIQGDYSFLGHCVDPKAFPVPELNIALCVGVHSAQMQFELVKDKLQGSRRR